MENQFEERIQAEIVSFFWNNYPATRGHIFHVPNGGYRNAREGAKLRSIGVIAGVPDLCIVWNGKCSWVELKTIERKLSSVQKEIHLKWLLQGISVFTAYGKDEAINHIMALISEDSIIF